MVLQRQVHNACSDLIIRKAPFRHFIISTFSCQPCHCNKYHGTFKTKSCSYKFDKTDELSKGNLIQLLASERNISRQYWSGGWLLYSKLFFCTDLNCMCELLMCRETQNINWHEILTVPLNSISELKLALSYWRDTHIVSSAESSL